MWVVPGGLILVIMSTFDAWRWIDRGMDFELRKRLSERASISEHTSASDVSKALIFESGLLL